MFVSTFAFLMVLAPSTMQVAARPAKPCGSKGGAAKAANGKAIYMLSNQASNSVVAVPIAGDGTLNEAGGSSTDTGGSGANGVDGSTNQPAAPDPLFSQSALTVAGNVSQMILEFFMLFYDCKTLIVEQEPVRSQCRIQHSLHVRH